jgi:hypothetical protein
MAAACLCGGMAAAIAAEPAHQPERLQANGARFAVSYESLSLPGNEKMGLLGGSFLYGVNNWLSLGGSAYGAMAGQRGGFITLGFAADLHKRFGQYFGMSGGGFVGGGGGRGGYKLQGGGLMLRSHLGVMFYPGNWGALGLGVSRVDFPNGSIHSTQPYLSYTLPFSTFLPTGWVDLPATEARPCLGVRTAEQEFATIYRRYRVPSGTRADNGGLQHRSIGLAGAQWTRYLDEHLFLKLESEGAMQGKSNGYMQILLGGGYRLMLGDDTWVKGSLSLGPAGGGNVATGGGVLLDAQLTLQQKLGDHLYIESGLGYVRAPGGGFRAVSMSAMLGYHAFTPDIGREAVAAADLGGFEMKHLRLRLADQRYLQDAPNWRNHHVNLNVDLLGFQLDYFVNDWLYLSGHGIGAYRGKGGGYMTGLLGAGARIPVAATPLFVDADLLIGAAGGGGLDVAGGLVWQVDAGLGWQFTDACSVQASYGLMRAPKGHFRARVLTLSLARYFSVPVM